MRGVWGVPMSDRLGVRGRSWIGRQASMGCELILDCGGPATRRSSQVRHPTRSDVSELSTVRDARTPFFFGTFQSCRRVGPRDLGCTVNLLLVVSLWASILETREAKADDSMYQVSKVSPRDDDNFGCRRTEIRQVKEFSGIGQGHGHYQQMQFPYRGQLVPSFSSPSSEPPCKAHGLYRNS